MSRRLLIIVTAPPEFADSILDAVSQAGGGTVGNYTHCGFMNSGTGRFLPDTAAKPAVGSVGVINSEPEVRIETFCERSKGRAVLQAIREAHPYEEPVIHVVPLLDAVDL